MLYSQWLNLRTGNIIIWKDSNEAYKVLDVGLAKGSLIIECLENESISLVYYRSEWTYPTELQRLLYG